MTELITILVLGVGGNVSQGILKALAISQIPCRIVGACVSSRSAGLYTVDKAYVSPQANDPTFLEWLIAICQRENVRAVLSGVEPVLTTLSRYADEIYQRTGATCIVSRPEQLAIGDDKLLTCQWLEQNNFNFPRYAATTDWQAVKSLVRQCGYPLIAKPRSGKGAAGIFEIRTVQALEALKDYQDYLIEEYLGTPDSEFTVGCFSDREGVVRGTIAMRRELLCGTTYRAELGDYPEVRAEAARIAAALKPYGPCNIQLLISQGRPVCFEINIRFSGTTPMRARLGFNDVEAAIRHYVLGEPAYDLPLITQGLALRYWNELYVDEAAYRSLEQVQMLELSKHSAAATVENYGMRQ